MNEPTRSPREPSRREFAGTVAAAAAAVAGLAASPGAAPADDPPKPKEGTPGVVQALADAARARYGKHLTDEQLAAVQRSITNSLPAGDRLAKMGLKNADEPAVVFRADLP